jgi:hypothetical protein
MKRIALLGRLPEATALLVLLGCGADLTLPPPPDLGLAVAVQGDHQTGTVGEALPDPVVVEVKTDGGEPQGGLRVAFVPAAGSAGQFDPDTAITDARGRAETHWLLGTAPGLYTAEARLLAGGDSVLVPLALQATAGPGDPDTLRAVGPTIQPGQRGEELAEPLVVMAVDRFGNPVAGAEVRWETTSGSGELSAQTTPTGPDGTASVIWTLGNRVGVQRATATVEPAQPVLFAATVFF